jgi:dihydrofolate synthase/folylpolyglutamate synthase
MKQLNQSHSTRNLDEWLSYLESIHSSEIDMGLERTASVAKKLSIDLSSSIVITVAGTNGKGTTCAFLENALLLKNKTVAVYSSPHITMFNERLRLNKQDIDDHSLINAFELIESTRGDVSLTYYEYTTLAALLVIMQKKTDYIILEVGLGGRLDATNIIDATIAVITTIDLDHQAFLGNDRESIGFEKAGIMRQNQLVVIGDKQAPNSVLQHGKQLNTQLYRRGRDFHLTQGVNSPFWQCTINNNNFIQLPASYIPQDNIVTALMVLNLLTITLTSEELIVLVETTKVPGRTEVMKGHCQTLLDVGHNPLAARYLAEIIPSFFAKKVHAVVGMLADKDITNTLQPLINRIDHWYLASLDVPRGANAKMLEDNLAESAKNVLSFDNVVDAYKMSCLQAEKDDLILVFGSFFTVSQVKAFLN